LPEELEKVKISLLMKSILKRVERRMTFLMLKLLETKSLGNNTTIILISDRLSSARWPRLQ
jgi:hypothetical protein